VREFGLQVANWGYGMCHVNRKVLTVFSGDGTFIAYMIKGESYWDI
jgi:hypothetical protein